MKANELLFAATARCRCGAGLAYALEFDPKKHPSAWICSAVLLGEVPAGATVGADGPFGPKPETPPDHDAYEFWCYEIKSEAQPSAQGRTTRRPEQGHLEWEPKAKCKKCGANWIAPRRRPESPGAWKVPPCPGCGEKCENPDGSSNMSVEVRACTVWVDGQ